MADNHTPRRLTAVVAADIAGFSRLMGADEEETLSVFKSHLRSSLASMSQKSSLMKTPQPVPQALMSDTRRWLDLKEV